MNAPQSSSVGVTPRKIIWAPQAGPQFRLLTCPVFEVFFGGARGGGKTDGMLGDWVSHSQLWGDKASGLMVRRTLKQLEDTIKRSKQIYGAIGAKYNDTSSTWTFPNGAQIKFRYLERDDDADQYQGHSYTRIYVEELGTFPNPSPIFKLMATLRSGAGVACGFRATGNPGGPGHQWVRARYIDAAPPWQIVVEKFVNPFNGEEISRERVYIPSKVSDNKYLGTDYIANLQMVGSPNLVRAWLEGDWSVIEGAFFPEFTEAKHVIHPFPIPEDWLRFRSMDWGSAAPFSVGWWAVASDDYEPYAEIQGRGRGSGTRQDSGRLVIPRGAMVRYREWYGASKPNIGLKLPAEEVGYGIKMREASDGKIVYGVLDPSAFASDGGPSIAERLARSGVYMRPADNKRVTARGAMGGWDQLRQRLLGVEDRPAIYFFDTCRDAIRTLPALQHDPDRTEDVDSEGEDHACDEIRYACMSRPFSRHATDERKLKPFVTQGPAPKITFDFDKSLMERVIPFRQRI
jgi:hypothetical protein